MRQALFEQVVLETRLEKSTVHFTPQAPQLLTSSAGCASQPSVVTLLQFWYLGTKKQEVWQSGVDQHR
jgi:hypothetical protein